MDKSRQQFEEEFKKQYPISLTNSDLFIKEIAFKFWQASRESLGIELPSKKDCSSHSDFDFGFNLAIDECKEILISNGVKIKNE